MGQKKARSQEGKPTEKNLRRSQKAVKKRGKEVAAMTSLDIFLRLAILCFLALSQVRAKSKHYLIETKDHKDDDPRLNNLNRYGKWPPTTKWPEPTTTWPETTTTTTWTTTTTTWTTTPPPTTRWTTTPHWKPTPSKWKNNAKDEDDLAE